MSTKTIRITPKGIRESINGSGLPSSVNYEVEGGVITGDYSLLATGESVPVTTSWAVTQTGSVVYLPATTAVEDYQTFTISCYNPAVTGSAAAYVTISAASGSGNLIAAYGSWYIGPYTTTSGSTNSVTVRKNPVTAGSWIVINKN